MTPDTLVSELKGVGPSKRAALTRLGIKTVDDLLHHFPSGYTFAPPLMDPYQFIVGKPVTTCGKVERITGYGHKFGVTLSNGVSITWFGGGYLRSVIFKGTQIVASGIAQLNWHLINPTWHIVRELVSDSKSLNTVTYPVVSGITSKDISRLIAQVLTHRGFSVEMRRIHQPVDQGEADWAREFFKEEELFYMQLGLEIHRSNRARVLPNVICAEFMPLDIWKYFPFTLTCDQKEAIRDITYDMKRPSTMNRLLQGDVGSGKTAVAAYAAMCMALNGGQTAILCPTQILAGQHYQAMRGYFDAAGVKSCNVADDIASLKDDVDIVVGTTALLGNKIRFRNLGLVIVDELHKFGVEQKAALRKHGNPHCLYMSATPIPRTIAMTVFGDLDISIIREMPPGRKPVQTQWVSGMTDELCQLIQRELAIGHQIYVVCPRIEALDNEMRAVEEVWQEYAKLFPYSGVDMLHSKLSPLDRGLVIAAWKEHRTGILVSTTVVEVGIDNPYATVMVVEGAERFGLAQLHQLRGRVGRGTHQSYCFLLSDTESAEARARLRAMEQTTDGFEIAEVDLKLRGPGDLFSTRQHGLPDLKIADLVEDYDLLLRARERVTRLIEQDPGLTQHPLIKVALEKRFGANLLLGDAA